MKIKKAEVKEKKFQKIEDVLIGADPEFFIRDIKTKELYPSIGLIGGTKRNPRLISDEGHGLQEDNVAVELTFPPVKTAEDLINSIKFGINYVKGELAPSYEPVIQASGIFKEEYLQSDEAKAFGCSPEFDVYTNAINEIKCNNPLLRVCGGHVHCGYKNPNPEISQELIKYLDIYLGIPSILMDKDVDRKKLYGKAGSHRLTSYGFEYRTLSNFWLKSNELMLWMFNNTMLAIEKYNEKAPIYVDEKTVISTINNQKRDYAHSICEDLFIPVLSDKIKHTELCAV